MDKMQLNKLVVYKLLIHATALVELSFKLLHAWIINPYLKRWETII